LYDQLSRNNIFDFGQLIDRWAVINNNSEIIVRPYEKAQFKDGNIFDDFLAHMPIKIDGLEKPKKVQNPSIRPNQIKISEMLQNYCSADQLRTMLAYVEGLNDKSKFMLSKAERQSIIDTYKPMNDKIAERLGQKKLFFSEVAEEDNEPLTIEFIQQFLSKISFLPDDFHFI
jgi:hypothetical protein